MHSRKDPVRSYFDLIFHCKIKIFYSFSSTNFKILVFRKFNKQYFIIQEFYSLEFPSYCWFGICTCYWLSIFLFWEVFRQSLLLFTIKTIKLDSLFLFPSPPPPTKKKEGGGGQIYMHMSIKPFISITTTDKCIQNYM